MRTRTPDPSFERSLRRILVTVLAMPFGAIQACGSKTPAPVATTTDPNAADATEASVPLDPVDGGSASSDPCAPIQLDSRLYDDSGSPQCSRFMRLPCGLPAEAAFVSGCSLDPLTCNTSCESPLLFGCSLAAAACGDAGAATDADIIVDCVVCAGAIGRRPRGLQAPPAVGAVGSHPSVGEYFAAASYLESASVTAFRELRRSLVELDAPSHLSRAADRAATDERRHAAATARLARRFGGNPQVARITPTRAPSLEGVLVDNAVEGCVGESYGALVAMWQAARARDAEVARTLHGIARDEARHASLSWSLLQWGSRRLDPAARSRILRRIEEALGRLRASVDCPVPRDVERIAGHPGHQSARTLFNLLEGTILLQARAALEGGGRAVT